MTQPSAGNIAGVLNGQVVFSLAAPTPIGNAGQQFSPGNGNGQNANATLALARQLYGTRGVLIYRLFNPIQADTTSVAIERTPGEASLQTCYIYQINAQSLAIETLSPPNTQRTKISEDNSPLPRDRIIFNYDYFNRTPQAGSKFDIHKITGGFETNFLDQTLSIEFRLPFASNLSSSTPPIEEVIGSRTAELGNLYLAFKALLYSNPFVNISAGFGMALPTADNT